MRNLMRYLVISLLIISVALQAACSNGNTGKQTPNTAEKGKTLRSQNVFQEDPRIALLSQEGNMYFPIDELVRMIGYQSEWNHETQTLDIGDIDVFYKITMNSTRAVIHDEEIELADQPILINQRPYAPVSVLSDLFNQDIHYEVQGNELIVHSIFTDSFTMEQIEFEDAPAAGVEPFFQDDPEDPFGGDDTSPDPMDDQMVWMEIGEGDIIPAHTPKNININALIRTATRYMGVPYQFGAKPYYRSKKFDCSSYVQFIYGKYGIKLPRVSRNQAKHGRYVSRKKLRKGDLLFFSVPGRFKSDKTVGHVGIYIGRGKMINTYSNRKGVHITNVNRGYWYRKYLHARRVAY
jgi:hypothetical protein